MAHEYPKIAQDQHSKILEEKILRHPDYLNASSQERPRAIIMAGQPGAGKGGLVRAAEAELGGNVVTVDPDALRDHHPQADNLKKQRPYTWSGETHGDASAWATELRDAAISERKNIILDTTAPRADIIKDLQAKGYDVEVRAIATHRLESELGVDQRFTGQLMDDGYGRYVPGEVRDNVYKQLPDHLDNVARETGAPISIFDREGQLHYDSRTNPRVSPGQALEAAREGRMNIFRAGEMERSIHDQRAAQLIATPQRRLHGRRQLARHKAGRTAVGAEGRRPGRWRRIGQQSGDGRHGGAGADESKRRL